jgi:hypothetical protein
MKLDPYIEPTPRRTQKMARDFQKESEPKPKYLTMAQVEPIYGLGRTKLYDLMAKGLIRAVKLGERENKHIKVLIDVASLEAYLNGLPDHVIPSLEDK